MIKKNVAVSVDIGGTNTVIGFVDEQGNYLCGDIIPTQAEEDASKFVLKLTNRIKSLQVELEDDISLAGIGIAAPSCNYWTGIIESPSNLKWGTVNFVDMMKEYFDIEVALINDANAAAIGEMHFGAARGLRNFVVLTLGTGLGCGIVVDGRVLHGEQGFAGELGHTIVIPNGRECGCGKMGCLETYVSASGLKRNVFELMSSTLCESKLRDYTFNNLSSHEISKLALKGDLLALKAFEYTGEVLGQALVNVVYNFNPQAIILFGGLADSDSLLLQPTLEFFNRELREVYKGKVDILKSELQSGKAAVLGAASLIFNKMDGVPI